MLEERPFFAFGEFPLGIDADALVWVGEALDEKLGFHFFRTFAKERGDFFSNS